MVSIRRAAQRAAGFVFSCAAGFVFLSSTPAFAQVVPPPLSPPLDLSGPRVGLTVLSPGVVDKLATERIDVRPIVSQFGWQVEKRFYGGSNGLTAVTEWVGLLGGLEQGLVIPSLSWLAGLRTRNGVEFGAGPNVTPVGVALVLAAGTTFRSGALNFPVNVAVTPTRAGVRVSVLTGFNGRR
jgi:hypothetical protein